MIAAGGAFGAPIPFRADVSNPGKISLTAAATCIGVPTPGEAILILPGLAFHCPMSRDTRSGVLPPEALDNAHRSRWIILRLGESPKRPASRPQVRPTTGILQGHL